MMISTKGRYALQVMLDLAQQCPDAYISLHDISQRQAVSMKYLEAIVAMLNKAGMVESRRGKSGGYRLTRAPEDYTVGAILKLTEGTLAPVACMDCDSGCTRVHACMTRPMWQELDRLIDDFLESRTLADLLTEDKAILEQKPTVSFEVFPPKQWDKIEGTKAVVKEMVKSHPAFMSVTYGAAGTTSGFTTEIAREILDDGVTPLAHLTCLTSTRDKIHQVVAELQENGIENILALRGDIPRDFQFPAEQYFEHAYQLVNEIRTLGDFCIGGACYPEVHPESKNRVEDLEHLKQKVDCGVDFLTTQMFFDNTVFYNFREMCAIKGIDVPLIAGIMPITKASQLERTVKLSGCSLPTKFVKIVERFGDRDDAMQQAGIVYAAEQIIDLMANGVDHIHIYTMNKPDVAGAIVRELGSIIHE